MNAEELECVVEIKELMRFKDWSKTQLAAALDVTDSTVMGWLSGRRNPGGPAKILMRQWLSECREYEASKIAQSKKGRAKAAV